ncbi:O-antigen polymerase [Flavobacterium sp. RHBU_3]|uniref:O-antigen polymerase n=1 Tax=Flavobacterium sp. RHBU_3 TaxID=3391184 RepID=UPI0039849F2E
MGYKYMVNTDVNVYLVFTVYELICLYFILYYWKRDIKKNFIYFYFFLQWFIYNGFGLVRISYLETFRSEEIYLSYMAIIGATFLFFIGIRFSNFVKVSRFEFLERQSISKSVYYTIAGIYALYNLYVFSLSGGFINYLFSDYQDKAPEGMKTTVFILSGIFGYFKYLNITYFFERDKNSPPKIVVYGFFLFTLVNVFSSGASLGVLSILLVIYLYKYCLTNQDKIQQIANLKKYLYLILGGGVLLGLLIRFNRTDLSSFSFAVLDNAQEEVLASPTFDSAGNFIMVCNRLEPLYEPNQVIYPFVNFLPRVLFPWKPMELGRIISYQFYGFLDDEIGGFAPTPMGEFYYDFGVPGIVLGVIGMGFVLGIVQKKLNATKDNKWKWMFLVTLLSLLGTIPAWYTGFGVRVVYLLLFIVIIGVINKVYKFLKIA